MTLEHEHPRSRVDATPAPTSGQDAAVLPLPPGSSGWPFLGETLSFLTDSFAFVESRFRKHGPVFRTHLLGSPAAVIVGPESSATFVDAELIERNESAPPHIIELFAGKSLPFLDGETHRVRKALVMSALNREALADYLPRADAIVTATLERWRSQDHVSGVFEMKRLALEIIMANIIGVSDADALDTFVRQFIALTGGFSALPIRLPGTALWRALSARDAILSTLRTEVAQRRSTPTSDGLGRLLGARLSGGEVMNDDEATLEVHHMFLAGYIVFAEFAAIAIEIARAGAATERLRAEIQSVVPHGPVTHQHLSRLPYLLQFVKEVKRCCPVLPFIFAKAKTTFAFHGAQIPKGWMVLWALRENNRWPSSFDHPERFDPERFGEARAEDRRGEHAFVPQGAGPVTGHRCAGLDYATLMMQLFTINLARDYDVSLASPSTDYNWKAIPPEPKDGLLLKLTRRAGGAD